VVVVVVEGSMPAAGGMPLQLAAVRQSAWGGVLLLAPGATVGVLFCPSNPWPPNPPAAAAPSTA
jgi:hypothetical protein